MDDQERIELALELLAGTAPVEGSVTPKAGSPITFTGWMPLMSILEAAHEGRLDPPAATGDER